MSNNKSDVSINRTMFSIPLLEHILVYAPLHQLAALLDDRTVSRLRNLLEKGQVGESGQLAQLAELLNTPGEVEPRSRQGALKPRFLGLLPTRGCMLACRYCGFLSPDESQKMSLEMARDAVNWYMNIVKRERLPRAEVHFFGGEPFSGEDVVDLAVKLARRRAAEIGCDLRFEVATNGMFNETRARWIAANISTIVLSFDGPQDIQNHHRTAPNDVGSYETVARSARIFSEGAALFCLRACVTEATVDRMPEIATWFCQQFRPDAVSFEPLQPTPFSESAGLYPPDPWDFARNFIAAAHILEAHGVKAVYATADIHTRHVSFCPVDDDLHALRSRCYTNRQLTTRLLLRLIMQSDGVWQGQLHQHLMSQTHEQH